MSRSTIIEKLYRKANREDLCQRAWTINEISHKMEEYCSSAETVSHMFTCHCFRIFVHSFVLSTFMTCFVSDLIGITLLVFYGSSLHNIIKNQYILTKQLEIHRAERSKVQKSEDNEVTFMSDVVCGNPFKFSVQAAAVVSDHGLHHSVIYDIVRELGNFSV